MEREIAKEEFIVKTYPNAAQGLKLLFIGEIVAIIGAILSLVPVLGPILMVASEVLILLGLYKAGADDQGYHTAFIISIANLVVGILNIFVSGVFSSILTIGSTILSLMVVYYVVTTTGNLGHSIGNEELEAKGKTVWTLYLICAIASVVITLISLIPLLGPLAGGVLGVIVAIIQIIAYILYLIFLSKASQALA
jgi:hypothetical protein